MQLTAARTLNGLRFRSAFLAFSVFFLGWVYLEASQVRPALDQGNRARITGVVIDNKLSPIEGVRVAIRGTPLVAITNESGEFSLKEAPSGEVLLTTQKPGFAAVRDLSHRLPENSGIFLLLDPGGQVKLHLQIAHIPVVRGQVLDSLGQPAIGVRVTPFRYVYDSRGRKISKDYQTARTDDRGQYRFGDLEPALYGFRFDPPDPLSGAGGAAYSTAYYPDTSDIGSASTVEIASGVETRLTTQTLYTPPAGHTLKIHVVNQTNSPAVGTMSLSLRSAESEDIESGALVRSLSAPFDGMDPEISHLLPGRYHLAVQLTTADGPMTGSAGVEIGTADVKQELAVSPPARVRGSIVVRGVRGEILEPAGLQLHLVGAAAGYLGRFRVRSGSDGNLSISRAPPGSYRIEVVGVPSGFFVESIHDEIDSDLLRNELVVKPYGEKTLRVTVLALKGQIQGTVSDAKGASVPGAVVVLLPDARADVNRIAVGLSDSKGGFQLQCDPGKYRVYSWTELDGSAYLNDAFMERYRDRGVPVHVEDGVTSLLEVVTLE